MFLQATPVKFHESWWEGRFWYLLNLASCGVLLECFLLLQNVVNLFFPFGSFDFVCLVDRPFLVDSQC